MKLNLDADLALAQRLADAAGAAIRPHFRSGLASERKEDASPVTLADRAAEQAMRAILKKPRPMTRSSARIWQHAGHIGPQLGAGPHRRHQRLSGRGAIFGTLIALVVEGWPVLGVIDQPIARERCGRLWPAHAVQRRPGAHPPLPRTGRCHHRHHRPALFFRPRGRPFHGAGRAHRLPAHGDGGDCYNMPCWPAGIWISCARPI
jgi:hypothetical protein